MPTTLALPEIATNPICVVILSQYALGDCTTKIASNSFSCQRFFKFRRSLPFTSKSNVRRHQNLALASPLHCCAYATGCTENKGVLTKQALLLSK